MLERITLAIFVILICSLPLLSFGCAHNEPVRCAPPLPIDEKNPYEIDAGEEDRDAGEEFRDLDTRYPRRLGFARSNQAIR